MKEPPFPIEAWREIFSTVPNYPMDLPDEVVRHIADMAIRVREMAEGLGAALKTREPLKMWMYPSLISGSLKRVEEYISETEVNS